MMSVPCEISAVRFAPDATQFSIFSLGRRTAAVLIAVLFVATPQAVFAQVGPRGALETSVPLAVPAYYHLEPDLNLIYSSQGSNGWLGEGWGLSGLSEISRRSPGRGAPGFGADDHFFLDGMELISCEGAIPKSTLASSPSCKHKEKPQHTDFATRIENFQRIAFDSSITGGRWFVWSKDGTKRTYAPRLSSGFVTNVPYTWRLVTMEDTTGHVVTFNYVQAAEKPGAGQEYLDSISYGPTTIRFITEQRPDPIISATGDALLVTTRRLKTVDINVSGQRLRSYALGYKQHPGSGRSVLVQVTVYGRDAVLDASGTIVSGTSLPPVQLSYAEPISSASWSPTSFHVTGQPPRWDGVAPSNVYSGSTQEVTRGLFGTAQFHAGDFDGDGRTDALLTQLSSTAPPSAPQLLLTLQLAGGTPVQSTIDLPSRFGWNFGDPPFDGREQLVRTWIGDVNGDGIDDLIILSWDNVDPNNHFGALLLQLNTAISNGDGTFRLVLGSFQSTTWQTQTLFVDARGPRCQVGDINGDGRADFVCMFQKSDGKQFLGTAISLGDGSFDLSTSPLLIATDPNGATNTKGNREPFETRPIAIGDVNADGLADIEILDLRPGEVTVCPADPSSAANCVIHYDLLTAVSNGDGTYRTVRTQTPWIRESGLLSAAVLYAADLNGDGKADYLSFAGATQKMAGQDLRTIRTAVTNINGGLTLNTQDIPAALSDRNNVLTLGDFNGDGKTDLLVIAPLPPSTGVNCSSYSSTRPLLVRIMGNGDGTFSLPKQWDDCSVSKEIQQPWTNVGSFSGLQAADTNGDGLADFLVAFALDASDSKKVNIGVYDDVSRASGLDTRRWIPANLTGSGRDDFIYVQSQHKSSIAYTLTRSIDGGYILKSTNLGAFDNSSLRSWKLLDVNGDGRDDLVHIQSFLVSFSLSSFRLLQIDTFLSNGDGSFSSTRSASFFVPEAKGDVGSWRPMDVNGDGKADLVYISWKASGVFTQPGGVFVSSLLSNGDGSWSNQPAQGPFAPTLGPLDVFPGGRLQDTQSWMVMDVDGDGRQDLVRVGVTKFATEIATLFSRGSNSWVLKNFLTLNAGQGGWDDLGVVADIINWRASDQNGDGMADLIHIGRTSTGIRIHTLVSQGNGDWSTVWQEPTFQPPVALDVLGETTRWFVADVNGDGRLDLVHVTNPGLLLRMDALVSDGTGHWTESMNVSIDPVTSGNPVSPAWRPAAVAGSGEIDVFRIDVSIPTPTTPSELTVAAVNAAFPLDLLTSYASYGGDIKIEYAPSSQYAPFDPTRGCMLPVGAVVQVVANTKIHDGRGLEDRSSYGYACPVWSPLQRTFLGWTDISADRPGVANRDPVKELLLFAQTETCGTQLQMTAHVNAAGRYIAEREIINYPSPSGPPYTCLQANIDHLEEGQGSTAQNVFRYFSYDEFGNVVAIVDQGVASRTDDKRTVARSFNPATGPYVVGLPSWEGVSDGVSPTTTLRRSRFFCYDGSNGSDTLSCPGLPTKGLLTAVQQVDDQGLYVKSQYAYSSFGALAVASNPLHFGAEYKYDQTDHLYPETICDAVNHCTTLLWDKVLGKISKVTDPNHVLTKVDYDPLGRIRKVTLPNGTILQRQYLQSGNPNLQHTHDIAGEGNKADLWIDEYYDGLGRIYKTVRKGDAIGSDFQQNRVYTDASARVYQVSDWFRTAAPQNNTLAALLPRDNYKPHYETYTYDGAGRVTRQTHPDGAYRTWSYGADSTVAWIKSTDELGHHRQTNFDAYGRPASVDEVSNGQPITTAYTYDALDRPLTIVDAADNVTSFTWNMLGRKIAVNDPELGLNKTTYDDAGQVKTTTDAKNAIITYNYDGIGRMTSKIYPDGTKVVWNYDETGHGASIGRLTSVIDPSGAGCANQHADEFTYGSMGEVTSWQKCIQQRSYTTNFLFDALGRDKRITYPDGEKVNYELDLAGHLQSVSGYVTGIVYDAAGRVLQTSNRNGTKETFEYDYTRGWLRRATHLQGTNSVYDAAYTYYPNGLVETTTSTTNRFNETYEYDDLDRLALVKGDFSQNFQYDAVGNMKLNSKFGIYTYRAPGPQGCLVNGTPAPCATPQAVVHAGSRTSQYDANGALSSVSDSVTGQNQGIDWTFDHKPSVISDFDGSLTTYTYDSATNLVSVQAANETLLKYGPLFDYSTARGFIKRYFANGTLVARNEAGSTYWYHGDERDSTRAITNSSGGVVGRFDYEPFGKVAVNTGSSTTAEFTDHSLDTAGGFVYMNARFYDPEFGRFISPDNVVPNPLFSQAFNRYAYTYDNPIAFTDPTGHQPIGISESYQEQASPMPGFDIWTPVAPFGTTPMVGGGWAPGQICSACHGATETYATPMAVPQRRRTSRTFAEVKEDLRKMKVSLELIQPYFPNLTVGDLNDLGIDPLTGKPKPEEYNFAVDLYGKFAKLLALQADRHMAYYAVADLAMESEMDVAAARQGRGLIYGPAYPISGAPPAGHQLVIQHFNAEGDLVNEFVENSGGMLKSWWAAKRFPDKMYLTHTEVKALTRIMDTLEEGDSILLYGFRPICEKGMCDPFMHSVSIGKKVDIFYYLMTEDDMVLEQIYLGSSGRVIPRP